MLHRRTMRFASEDGTLVTVEIQADEESRLRTGAIRSALVNRAYLFPVDQAEPCDAAGRGRFTLMPLWAAPLAGFLLPVLVVLLLHATSTVGGAPPLDPHLARFLWVGFVPLLGGVLTLLFAGIELQNRRFSARARGVREGLVEAGRIPT